MLNLKSCSPIHEEETISPMSSEAFPGLQQMCKMENFEVAASSCHLLTVTAKPSISLSCCVLG